MNKITSFKAIETHFDGYRFRSRLEARWGVFFKTLGIAYEYEKEGYVLNGIPYLPDFWLSEMDCFIEIKGQAPTQEELAKTRLLALYTGKPVHIMAGNIGSHQCYTDFPPDLYAVMHQEEPYLHREKEIATSPEVLTILQQLHEVGLSCTTDCGEIALTQRLNTVEDNSFYPFKYYLPIFTRKIQEQHDVLVALSPLLEEYEQDILAAITVEQGWKIRFSGHLHLEGLEWCQCEGCKELDIHVSDTDHMNCSAPRKNLISNSAYLQEAYDAARSARFEFGGK